MSGIALSPGAEDKTILNRCISRLRLEPVIAHLPKPLRVTIAKRRYGWFDFLLALQTQRNGMNSLVETEAQDAIFLHIPKTGGVSVAESLFNSHAASHTALYMYLALYGARRFDAMFKFAFIRNPWTRFASAYHFLRAGGLTEEDRLWARTHLAGYADINEFVAHGLARPEILNWTHFKRQTYYLRDPRTGRIGVDFLGRFETLAEDYATIAAELGTTAPLKHLNKTSRSASASHPPLTAQSIARLGDVYHEDVVALGYAAPTA